MTRALLFVPHARIDQSLLTQCEIEVIAHVQFAAQTMDVLGNMPNVPLVITDHTDTRLIEKIANSFASVAVIIVATHPSIHQAVEMMGAGAVAYLPYNELNARTLKNAVSRARVFHAEKTANTRLMSQAINILQQLNTPGVTNTPATRFISSTTPTTSQNSDLLEVRGVQLDTGLQEVSFRNEPIELSPTEYGILHTLMHARGQLVSFEDLAESVHGAPLERSQARSLLSAHISNLRNKLRDVGCDNFIVNRRGRGYFIDVDVESALQRGGEELRLILDATFDVIIQVDADAIIEYISPSIVRTLGYTQDEFIGASIEDWFEIVHLDDHPTIVGMLNAISQATTFEGTYRMQAADGAYVWLEVRNSPTNSNERGGSVCVVRDITDRMQAIAMLRESEIRYRLLIENVPDLILTVDREGLIRFVNHNTQVDTSTLLGSALSGWAQAEREDIITRRVQEAFQYGNYLEEETRALINNAWLWLRLRYCPIADDNGTVTELMLIVTDVTNSRIADRAIRESEERYRILAEHMTDLVTMHAPDGTYLYVSPSSDRVLGYAPEELLDRTPYDFVHPDDVKSFRRRVHEFVLAGNSLVNFTYRVRNANGEYVWLECSVQPVTDDRGTVIRMVATARNVSFRRHTLPARPSGAARDAAENR